jgi:hypothetical protein
MDQPEYPSMGEHVVQWNTMEFYSALKKKGILSFTTAWMTQEVFF